MKQYWLIKTEPDVFSLDDLIAAPKKRACWEGVRNYQARNFMRTMKKGDMALFYHSNAKPSSIVGVVRICKEAYVDHYAFDKQSPYYDSKSTEENPRWSMVDVEYTKTLDRPLSLQELKEYPELADMPLLRKGQRLSVMPVKEEEFNFIVEL